MIDQPTQPQPAAQPAAAPAALTGAKKILVVEDEIELQQLFVTTLTSAGYEVQAVGDGKNAYEKIKAESNDIVLLDIMLPEMDGIQILEKLKAENVDIPSKAVVLLTNLGQDTLVAKALSLGIRGYLVKSDYTPDQLLKEIEGYL
jgi:CheY-like chemotaxis protein